MEPPALPWTPRGARLRARPADPRRWTPPRRTGTSPGRARRPATRVASPPAATGRVRPDRRRTPTRSDPEAAPRGPAEDRGPHRTRPAPACLARCRTLRRAGTPALPPVPGRRAVRLSGQGRRPLEEGRCGRRPRASLCPDRRLFERGCDGLVRFGGRSRVVPHPAVRVVGVGRLGERPVRRGALLGWRRRVGGRAHQGMPEPHPGTDLDKLLRHSRRRFRSAQAQTPACPPEEGGVAGGVGGGEQHQPSGRLRQSAHPP